MKRVLFLLLITVSAISVSAQRDYRNNDRDERYHYKYDRKKNLNNRDNFRRQVAAINHQFDSRIHSVQTNPFLNRRQKNRKIHQLEMDRRVAIERCRDQFRNGRARDYARERRYNDDRW